MRIRTVFVNPVTYVYVFIHCIKYRIAGNFDGVNIDGLAMALLRSLMGEIMTDSLLDNLYLLYNYKIEREVLTDR